MTNTKEFYGATPKDEKKLADLKDLAKKGFTVKFGCEAKFASVEDDDNVWVSYCVAIYEPGINPEIGNYKQIIPAAFHSDGSVHFYDAVDEDETIVYDFVFWD